MPISATAEMGAPSLTSKFRYAGARPRDEWEGAAWAADFFYQDAARPSRQPFGLPQGEGLGYVQAFETGSNTTVVIDGFVFGNGRVWPRLDGGAARLTNTNGSACRRDAAFVDER